MIFSLFDKFYRRISLKMALKPYIEIIILKIPKHWYWKSSYHNSSYRNINIKIIEPPHLFKYKNKSLKSNQHLCPISTGWSNGIEVHWWEVLHQFWGSYGNICICPVTSMYWHVLTLPGRNLDFRLVKMELCPLYGRYLPELSTQQSKLT